MTFHHSESAAHQAIPQSLNLSSDKPASIPAYTRRVESIATNAQQFGEWQLANILLDTSTPGSFLDPSQSLLHFNLTIRNTNPYVDYVNFSACGAASLIQEMRIICQGTPVEEILDYNTMFEMWMDVGGYAQDEFKMYVNNGWRAPATSRSTEINFVKPPMVDREGVIMCPNDINMFGTPAKFNNEQGSYNKDDLVAYKGQKFTPTYWTNTDQATKAITIKAALAADGDGKMTTNTNTIDIYLADATASSIYVGMIVVNTTTATNAVYVISVIKGASGTNKATILLSGTIAVATNDVLNFKFPVKGTNTIKDIGTNYPHAYDFSKNNRSIAPGNIRSQTWTNLLDDTYVTWPTTLRPLKNDLQQEMRLNNTDLKTYRLQDYLQFLSNVKNIPVGCSPNKSMINKNDAGKYNAGAATQPWNFDASTNTLGTAGNITLTCYLPIFSGLLGLWAEKAFPTMLIAPGSFYIQVRFARASQAFQLTMDPCRRVIGTYRDYVPNYGNLNGYSTDMFGNVMKDLRSLAQIGNSAFDASIIPNPKCAAVTSAACNGVDFAFNAIVPDLPPDSWTKRTDYLPAFTSSVQNPLKSVQLNDAAVQDDTEGYLFKNYALLANAIGNATYSGTQTDVAFGQGNTTGRSMPQYVPMKSPWLYGQGWSAISPDYKNGGAANTAVWPGTQLTGTSYTKIIGDYIEEKASCFGTYLSASTPQVRRTFADGYTNNYITGDTLLPTQSNTNYATTYTISNLSYIGQQIILPDEVTASIVRMAVNGDISLTSHSCRTYRAICNQSPNQSIILPIKIASATALFLLFRNSNMEENFNYLSCTRNCPFTSYQFAPDTKFVGSDLPPNVKNITTQQPFTVQLRLGNELLPITPINSVNFLVKELERTIHATPDWGQSMPTIVSTRHYRSSKFDNIPANNISGAGSTEYLSMIDNDFLTPYVNVRALDDQTITDNPSYKDYGLTANDRGLYCLNQFLPPRSKFLIGFDLETFPNQSMTVRSGRYLGNGPITLVMTQTVCDTPSVVGGNPETYNVIAVVLHDIRFSIMAGGQVLAYY